MRRSRNGANSSRTIASGLNATASDAHSAAQPRRRFGQIDARQHHQAGHDQRRLPVASTSQGRREAQPESGGRNSCPSGPLRPAGTVDRCRLRSRRSRRTASRFREAAAGARRTERTGSRRRQIEKAVPRVGVDVASGEPLSGRVAICRNDGVIAARQDQDADRHEQRPPGRPSGAIRPEERSARGSRERKVTGREPKDVPQVESAAVGDARSSLLAPTSSRPAVVEVGDGRHACACGLRHSSAEHAADRI